MGIRESICLGLFWVFAASATAVAQPAPPVVPVAAAPVPAMTPTGQSVAEYVLGPEDVIEIEVVGQPDKVRSRVYADGTIQMNLIGKVQAGGKTSRELGDEIAALLKAGGYFAKPVVNVEIGSYASRYVTVLGAVGQPGLVPMNRPYRLSEVMARVGGAREGGADFVIVRSETGAEKHYRLDKLAVGDSSADPYVAPGDKIYVPVAEVFYISGQVMQPGTYAIRSDMTIRQAIARGGGLNESGTDNGVLVNRGGKKIKLDVNAKVEPNDVIVIRERLF